MNLINVAKFIAAGYVMNKVDGAITKTLSHIDKEIDNTLFFTVSVSNESGDMIYDAFAKFIKIKFPKKLSNVSINNHSYTVFLNKISRQNQVNKKKRNKKNKKRNKASQESNHYVEDSIVIKRNNNPTTSAIESQAPKREDISNWWRWEEKSSLPTDLLMSNTGGKYLYWYKNKYPIYIDDYIETIDKDNFQNTYKRYYLTLKCLKIHKQALIDFIAYVTEQYSVKRERTRIDYRSTIYEISPDGSWSNYKTLEPRKLKTIIGVDYKSILKDIKDFEDKEDWYVSLGIPFKRTYLFEGPPGNAKSSLIRALAHKIRREVFNLSFNGLSDFSLTKAVNSIGHPECSILVLEDIDSYINGREVISNGVNGDGVSFAKILAILDGLYYNHGLITIITTNKPEVLDEAILRFGRIDRRWTFKGPSKQEHFEKYLTMYYSDEKLDLSKIVIPKDEISYSELCRICMNTDSYDEAVKALAIYKDSNNISNVKPKTKK